LCVNEQRDAEKYGNDREYREAAKLFATHNDPPVKLTAGGEIILNER
jgi:hypothetical protein